MEVDLIKLIQTCSRSGVKELHYENLRVIFDRIEPKSEVTMPQPPIPVVLPPELKEKQLAQAKDRLFEQELLIKQENLERMVLEDPLQFEKLMAEGDLEDG